MGSYETVRVFNFSTRCCSPSVNLHTTRCMFLGYSDALLAMLLIRIFSASETSRVIVFSLEETKGYSLGFQPEVWCHSRILSPEGVQVLRIALPSMPYTEFCVRMVGVTCVPTELQTMRFLSRFSTEALSMHDFPSRTAGCVFIAIFLSKSAVC